MSVVEHLPDPDGLPPANGYRHAVVGSGRLIAISGQLPLDADGRLIDASDTVAQARQVFANLGRALESAGAGPRDVLRLGFFLVDLGDLPAVRCARDEFLGGGPPPASSLVQVAGLVVPGARLEIDALAVIG